MPPSFLYLFAFVCHRHVVFGFFLVFIKYCDMQMLMRRVCVIANDEKNNQLKFNKQNNSKGEMVRIIFFLRKKLLWLTIEFFF